MSRALPVCFLLMLAISGCPQKVGSLVPEPLAAGDIYASYDIAVEPKRSIVYIGGEDDNGGQAAKSGDGKPEVKVRFISLIAVILLLSGCGLCWLKLIRCCLHLVRCWMDTIGAGGDVYVFTVTPDDGGLIVGSGDSRLVFEAGTHRCSL